MPRAPSVVHQRGEIDATDRHPAAPALRRRRATADCARPPSRSARRRPPAPCADGGVSRMAVDHDALRLARRRHRAHRELRIVLPHGADAGQDRAGARAPAMAVGARHLAGDPLRSRRRRAPCGRRGSPRPSSAPTDVRASTRDTKPMLSSRAASSSKPTSTAMPAARSRAAPPAASGLGSAIAATTRATPAAMHGFGARRRAADVIAGLERDVERGAARIVPPRRAHPPAR